MTRLIVQLLALCVSAWIGITATLASDYVSNSQDRTSDVQLTIKPSDAQAIRCQLVLAHFITQTITTVKDNATVSLQLRREDDTGTLAERTSGRSMLVENILCGVDGDWQATVVDMSLSLIRSSTSHHFESQCVLREKLDCTISSISNSN